MLPGAEMPVRARKKVQAFYSRAERINSMKRKSFAAFAGLLLVALVTSGCGSAKSDYGSSGYAVEAPAAAPQESVYYDYNEEYAEEEADEYEEAGGLAYNATAQASGNNSKKEDSALPRKLVRNVNLSAETEELDEFEKVLVKQIEDAGGYIESSERYGGTSLSSSRRNTRSANYTIRVPADRLDSFVSQVKNETNVLSQSSYVEDITLSYYDTDSRRKALAIEQEQLLEMLDKAETVEDMITIRDSLSEVTYQLQNMESQMRVYNNRVDYATIRLDVREVQAYTPVVEKSALQRMSEGIVYSFNNVIHGIKEFFIGFGINLPYIVVWAIVIVLIVLLIRFIGKLSEKHREKKAVRRERKNAANRQAIAARNRNSAPAGAGRGKEGSLTSELVVGASAAKAEEADAGKTDAAPSDAQEAGNGSEDSPFRIPGSTDTKTEE